MDRKAGRAVFLAAGRPRVNLTLYHINPLAFPAVPVNMDLGDLAGDLFFDVSLVTHAFACAGGTPVHAPGVICRNDEVKGDAVGVTKLVVEVDAAFGPYATCNVCVNGSSPMNASHACEGSQYVCDCESGTFPPKREPCGAAVGWENTSAFLGSEGFGRFCGEHSGPRKVSVCAVATAADKLQGIWYSTLAEGFGVTWRLVEVVKRVRRSCHAESFYSAVEQRAPACFASCGPPPRNVSSLCWAGCFIDAALGPAARNSTGGTRQGMSRAELMAAWSRPFESGDPARGGCPDVRAAPRTDGLAA